MAASSSAANQYPDDQILPLLADWQIEFGDNQPERIAEAESKVLGIVNDLKTAVTNDGADTAYDDDLFAADRVRREIAKVPLLNRSPTELLGIFAQQTSAADARAVAEVLKMANYSTANVRDILTILIGRTDRTNGSRTDSTPAIGAAQKAVHALEVAVGLGAVAGIVPPHAQDRPPAVVRVVQSIDAASDRTATVTPIGSRQRVSANGQVTDVTTGKVIQFPNRTNSTGLTIGELARDIASLKPPEPEVADNSEAVERAKIIELARQQLGVPYVFDAENPKGPAGGPGSAYDCSGLTQDVLTKAGVKNVDRTAAKQQKQFPSVIDPTLINRLHGGEKDAAIAEIEKALQKGDLAMFWLPNHRGIQMGEATHVGIYMGNGMMIAAGSHGVTEQPVLWDFFIDGVNPLAFGWQTNLDLQPNKPAKTPEEVNKDAIAGAIGGLSTLKPPQPPKVSQQPASIVPIIDQSRVNTATERDMANMWQRHGDLIQSEADKRHINVDVAMAFLQTEAGGNGFNSDGSLKIRFEDAWFKERTGIEIVPDHSHYEIGEYATFAKAKAINVQFAYESISMGAGQIMGGNYGLVGYNSARQMFEAFSGPDGEVKQIQAMFAYIDNKPGLLGAVQQGDAGKISELYNGKDPRVNPVYEHDIEHYEATFHGITATP